MKSSSMRWNQLVGELAGAGAPTTRTEVVKQHADAQARLKAESHPEWKWRPIRICSASNYAYIKLHLL